MVKRANEYVSSANISEKTTEWLRGIYAHNYRRSSLVLDKSKCALIVVDMLNYFAHPGGRAYLPATESIIPGIAKLIGLWRESGNRIVFTRHSHTGEDDLGMLGKFFSDYIRDGEPESEIISGLTPRRDEPVFRKNTYDAFYNTELEEYLKESACNQVLITGVLTQLCCETTARSAFVRGFEVYIPADGTASSTEDLHIGSLRGLASGVAVITSIASIIKKTEHD